MLAAVLGVPMGAACDLPEAVCGYRVFLLLPLAAVLGRSAITLGHLCVWKAKREMLRFID